MSKIQKILADISKLSDEELSNLTTVLGSVSQQPEQEEEKPKRKQRRKPKGQVDKKENSAKVEKGRSTKSRRLKKSRGKQDARRGKGKGKMQSPGLPVNVDGDRPNLFEDSEFSDMHKDDTAFQKKLEKQIYGDKGYKAKKRRKAPDMVEAMCTKCEGWWEVLPAYCYKDDDGETVFVCDECSMRK